MTGASSEPRSRQKRTGRPGAQAASEPLLLRAGAKKARKCPEEAVPLRYSMGTDHVASRTADLLWSLLLRRMQHRALAGVQPSGSQPCRHVLLQRLKGARSQVPATPLAAASRGFLVGLSGHLRELVKAEEDFSGVGGSSRFLGSPGTGWLEIGQTPGPQPERHWPRLAFLPMPWGFSHPAGRAEVQVLPRAGPQSTLLQNGLQQSVQTDVASLEKWLSRACWEVPRPSASSFSLLRPSEMGDSTLCPREGASLRE